jgi:predicted aspartyl protease
MGRRGIIKETEVRQVTVEAMVDTGARPLVITEALRQRLGLEIEEEETVLLAGKVPQKCARAELVNIHWKNRHTAIRPLVLPAGDETLLGVIPLEDMDLKVNPVDCCLEGPHGDEPVYTIQ